VAPPGIGKSQVISKVESLWYDAKEFHVCPTSVTRAAIIDALAESPRKVLLANGQPYEYHSLLVANSELGVLLSAHDLDMMSNLNNLFDCGDKPLREKRRGREVDLEISLPQINILAGTQPGFLSEILPETAWTMGFTARFLMIYSDQAISIPLFDFDEQDELHETTTYKKLCQRAREVSKTFGRVKVSPEAQREFEEWRNSGYDPVPEHSKLEHYLPRRMLYVIKLATISGVARTGKLVVEKEDVLRAKKWLFSAEDRMPYIFKAMVGHSDKQVIEELHRALWAAYARTRQPIPEAVIYQFLQSRCMAERIPRVIEIANKSGLIAMVAGKDGYYIPMQIQGTLVGNHAEPAQLAR
jgi:hypothetical protein